MATKTEHVTIKEIADVKGGKRLRAGKRVQDARTNHPYIRVVDFGQDGFDPGNVKYITEDVYRDVRRYTISHDDIYISIAGTIGRVGVVPPMFSGANLTENAAKITNIRSDFNKLFLMYYLRSDYGQADISSKIVGTSQPKLALFRIKEIGVPHYSTFLQCKIASILSAYDDLIENNLRRIKILAEMAQALYREWFVKFRFPGHENVRMVDSPLGKIPEGWEVVRIDELVAFQNNGTKAGKHLCDRVYLPIDCLPRRSLGISEVKPWQEAKSSLHLFDEGDIIFGAMRPYFHKVIVAPFKGVTRKTCFVFKSQRPEYHAFSALTLFQDSTVSFANAHSKGATIPYAAWTEAMDGMLVVVPSGEIAQRYEEIVGPMISEVANIYFRNTNLRQTRDLILPKLISGELDVSDMEINIPEEAA